MRIQCNLLPLFLLGLVISSSMVEASTKKKKKGKKKKGKVNPSTSIFFDDPSEREREVCVSQVSKISESSSLPSLGSSSVQINGIPSVSSQLPHMPASSSSNSSSSTPELVLSQNDKKINIDTHSLSSSFLFPQVRVMWHQMSSKHLAERKGKRN